MAKKTTSGKKTVTKKTESKSASSFEHSLDPIGVVPVFSTRGLEYWLMFIALFVLATSLVRIVSDLVLYATGNTAVASEAVGSTTNAAALVSFVVFSYLFLRTKDAELKDPAIGLDPSRKRAIQLVIIVSFTGLLVGVIGFVSTLLNGNALYDLTIDTESLSMGAQLLLEVVMISVNAVIFGYYWRDDHRQRKLGK